MGEQTPKSLRIQIAVFGRMNVGKSSFINMLASQDVSIVSHIPGTTTDIVEKSMEFRPIGPVVFLDTAGIDDNSSQLSDIRVKRTASVFGRADVFTVITQEGQWGEYEDMLCEEARSRDVPLVVVVNKTDLNALTDGFRERLLKITPYVLACSSINVNPKNNLRELDKRDVIITAMGKILADAVNASGYRAASQTIVADLLPQSGLAVLVVPIDSGAPKGRLILPQVQVIRDLLDGGHAALVVRDEEFALALSSLDKPPNIVICDSQAVKKIAALTPCEIPFTTFSILFARFKGDFAKLACGAKAIGNLKKNDTVLIAEACAHHAGGDDIGRVKIPTMLRQHTNLSESDLHIDVCSGRDYPNDLERYSLIIHCGACMLTRRETLSRVLAAVNKNVPITNYGMAISYFQGVLDRVIKPVMSGALS